MHNYRFRRSERLKSETSISGLFESGSSFSVHPIRMVYNLRVPPDSNPLKIAFAVPKKSFKSAVSRNLLKRRMREAYRLNKHILPGNSIAADVILIYLSREKESFEKINESVIRLLEKLKSKSNKN
ncbi:MAG: ribonuclease P protein component [Bacteroidales bacterium]|nr:ribonuclease P protein component [Bacteroidales bacterium]